LNEILTIAIPVVVYIITSILGYRLLLKTMDERIQMAIDGVGEALGEIFEKPLVKQAMSMLGEKSGKVRGDNAMMDKIATDILDGPKLKAIKAAAKIGLGIDIDSYIEEDGAVKTLENLQGLASLIGFDIGQVMAGGLNGANLAVGPEANGINYYLGR